MPRSAFAKRSVTILAQARAFRAMDVRLGRCWNAHMRNSDMRVDHRDAPAQLNLPAAMLHRERNREVLQSLWERLVNMDVCSTFLVAVHIQAHSFSLWGGTSPACRCYPERDGLLVTGGGRENVTKSGGTKRPKNPSRTKVLSGHCLPGTLASSRTSGR